MHSCRRILPIRFQLPDCSEASRNMGRTKHYFISTDSGTPSIIWTDLSWNSSCKIKKPAGNRQTNCVHIYISIPEWLELCRKLACGELRYLWQERRRAGDNKPVQEWLGGTSAEKLLQYGKARPDGKSLSRVARLCTAQKFDFLFTASSGPGDKDSKGLIVPRFGKKPENHVAVGMTWDALAELLLITKTHYEAWLAAWYLSQIQAANPQPPAKTRKAPEIPAQQPEPAIQSQYVMPEYSGKSLF